MDGRGPLWFLFRLLRLQESLQERRAALEAQSLLLQFFRDADEEMAWLHEKLPSATAQDYGQSLSTVRHLQEKHQVLAHAGRLGRVCLRGAGGSQSRTGHCDPAKPLLWGHLVSLEILGWKLLRSLKDLLAQLWVWVPNLLVPLWSFVLCRI